MHVLFLCWFFGIALGSEMSVYFENGEFFTNDNTFDTSAPAQCSVTSDATKTGWSRLLVSTTGSANDTTKAYAAGYCEGRLTWESTYNLYNNEIASEVIPPEVSTWFNKAMEWIQRNVNANTHDPLWLHVGLVWEQFLGFVNGYNSIAKHKLTTLQLYYLQAEVEIMDVKIATGVDHLPDFSHFSHQQWSEWNLKRLHCSALVKVTPDLSDIYFGHATWSSYTTMLRQIKIYNFDFHTHHTAAQTVLFSGYPGQIASTDDYYTMSSGLAVAETTFSVFNNSLFTNYAKPQQLPYWIRVSVANRMARNSKEWAEIFQQHNSGTYNNQWIVLDYNKFTPFQPLPSETLYILESVPGYVEYRDLTPTLTFGYWPSYNVPYFSFMTKICNYSANIGGDPRDNDYQIASRGMIFRRNQTQVSDIDSFRNLLRYNGYKFDPLSFGNSELAIAARYDLQSEALCGGAIDAKVTSYKLMKNRQNIQSWAISGPTTSQHTLPPFDFKNTAATCPSKKRVGVMDYWDFDWELYSAAG